MLRRRADCRDLTIKVRLQEELSASNDEAVRANLAKDRFLATMSHELRTPMNAINGLLEVLQNTPLDAVQRSYVANAHIAARGLLRIVNDLLDLERLKVGALGIVPTSFTLADLIERIARLYENAALNKGVRLIVAIAPEIGGSYVGDALRIGQILGNLIDNAIKFTDEGEVTLLVNRVTTPEHAGRLRFEVRDTGIGIAPEQTEQLFEPFVQVDRSARSYAGSGLGLSISRKLAQAMQGDLGFEPNEPCGSCFWLEVPLRRLVAQDSPAHLSLSPERTLIVQTNTAKDPLVATQLRDWGFAAEVVTSCEAALESLLAAERSGSPHRLILIDWDLGHEERTWLMTSMQGAMHRGELHRAPTIIMITPGNQADSGDELTHLALAPDAVLTRPITPSKLYDAINELQKAGYTERPEFTRLIYRLKPIERLASRRGARILVVEDNATNQFVASAVLEQMGMIVDIASNGREALRKLANATYDLVLMDIHMPIMDGLEATRAIRATPQGAHLPVVARTASAYPEDRALAAEAGMNDFLSKPVDPQRLASVLLRWLPIKDKPLIAAGTPAEAGSSSLLQLPGFDVHGAVTRLGSEKLLLRVLATYNQDFADWESRARTAWQSGDLVNLRHLAHNLKGGSSSAGAVEAERAAAALEQALRGGTSIDEGAVSPLEVACSALHQAITSIEFILTSDYKGVA